jgi:hypothetical protein
MHVTRSRQQKNKESLAKVEEAIMYLKVTMNDLAKKNKMSIKGLKKLREENGGLEKKMCETEEELEDTYKETVKLVHSISPEKSVRSDQQKSE